MPADHPVSVRTNNFALRLSMSHILRRSIFKIALLALAFAAPPSLRAEVVSLDFYRREPFAGGKSFGEVGPYEILQGVARFAVDPGHKRNALIVDLPLAPRNQKGLVEFAADVFILAPKHPEKGNGAIFYDVNNRGNKLALRFFNHAGGTNDPRTAKDAGDGFLMRHGYTIVWCGWIGELLPGNDRLLMQAPIATDQGKPIAGLVRYEMVTNQPADTLPLSHRDGHGSYPPTKKGEAEGKLTWRLHPKAKPVPIPREQWQLIRQPVPNAGAGVPGTLGPIRLKVAGGFRPGYLYELICEAEGPIVQGLGFAAVRDLVSFLRYDSSKRNPFRTGEGKPALTRAFGFGVSQSGRFLRHFLYQAFNVDEHGRKVFDGLMPHVAGGGLGFFNHRFAQPTRHNAQHEEHWYPADVFPFTYGIATDPFSGRQDAILKRLSQNEAKLLPKIMHTQSAAEYWHRSGSLVHTDPLGKKDAIIPDNVRIYAFGGTQHGPASWPPTKGIGDNLPNPADYTPLLRALLLALDEWATNGKAPPLSVYPRIDQGTLVDWHQEATGFPAIPGVRYPEVIQQPSATFFGSQFLTKGIITIEPPLRKGDYVTLVPKCDKDGNDLGTLLVPGVAIPLATYTGWNLRHRSVGAEGMLLSLTGSFIPFPKTKKERLASGDPRLSVEERYGSFAKYSAEYEKACLKLVKQRYLLTDEAARLLADVEKKSNNF
jgi:hypothetical protein